MKNSKNQRKVQNLKTKTLRTGSQKFALAQCCAYVTQDGSPTRSKPLSGCHATCSTPHGESHDLNRLSLGLCSGNRKLVINLLFISVIMLPCTCKIRFQSRQCNATCILCPHNNPKRQPIHVTGEGAGLAKGSQTLSESTCIHKRTLAPGLFSPTHCISSNRYN